MKCPKCMQPIGPDDATCPSCRSVLVVEQKPTRPDEEKGWAWRHLAGVMGRAGCVVMIAQNALVLIGVAAFAGSGVAFLSGTNPRPDLGPVAGLGTVVGVLDLVGLGLVAVAMVVLGAGAMLLIRKDPFTEEEVRIPAKTAVLPMAGGLLVFAWILLTAVWRLHLPATVGRPVEQLFADFAATGMFGVSPASGNALFPQDAAALMMGLWIVAVVVLLVGAILLRLFVLRLPTKVFSSRPLKPSTWVDYMVFNLVLTLIIAAFPAGWITYRGVEPLYLTVLATKITVLPVFGILSYWSLLTRFDALSRVSLLVPVMKALPPGATTAGLREAEHRPPDIVRDPSTVLPPPEDDDMAGISRVK